MARRTGLKSSEEVEWKEREPKPIPVTVRRQSSTFKRFALANVRITCITIVKLACNSKIMVVVVGTFILLLFNERKTSKAVLFPLFQFPLLYFPQLKFPTP